MQSIRHNFKQCRKIECFTHLLNLLIYSESKHESFLECRKEIFMRRPKEHSSSYFPWDFIVYFQIYQIMTELLIRQIIHRK